MRHLESFWVQHDPSVGLKSRTFFHQEKNHLKRKLSFPWISSNDRSAIETLSSSRAIDWNEFRFFF